MRKKKRLHPIKIWIFYDIDHGIGQNLESDKKNPAKFCRSKVTEDRLQLYKRTKGKRQTAKREPTASPIPTWSPTVVDTIPYRGGFLGSH